MLMPFALSTISVQMRDLRVHNCDKKSYAFKIIIIGSLSCDILVIAVNLFRWDLTHLLTPFVEPFIEDIIYGAFAIFSFLSLLYIFYGAGKQKLRAIALASTNLIALGIVIFFPFTRLLVDVDFHLNLDRRERVIYLIQSGKLQPESGRQTMMLPMELRYLSKGGGEILIEKASGNLEIFFFTYRGILNDYSGYLYSSSIRNSSNAALIRGCREIINIQDHWFWVSCQ